MKKWFVSLLTITLLSVQSKAIAQSLDLNKINSGTKSTIELSVIKSSESPLTSKEHEYVLKATNNTKSNVVVRVIADNKNCNGKINVPFIQKFYVDNTKAEKIDNSTNIIIQANSSVEFFLELINPSDIALNSWNCTEIIGMGINNEILSNTILIESFIPDPKDFK